MNKMAQEKDLEFVYLSPLDAKQLPWTCEQINKRTLGKVMIQLCGNEGTEDDSNNAGLRRLLQMAISVIENESNSTLQNAEFKFYDDECNIYVVQAGLGENRFMFTLNEKLEPDFTVQRKSVLFIPRDLKERLIVLVTALFRCGFSCWAIVTVLFNKCDRVLGIDFDDLNSG